MASRGKWCLREPKKRGGGHAAEAYPREGRVGAERPDPSQQQIGRGPLQGAQRQIASPQDVVVEHQRQQHSAGSISIAGLQLPRRDVGRAGALHDTVRRHPVQPQLQVLQALLFESGARERGEGRGKSEQIGEDGGAEGVQ